MRPMLDTVLAIAAGIIWGTAYGWFFATDVRRWWRGRHRRRALAAEAHEQEKRAYAAWVRDIPPPRSRAAQFPPPPPAPPRQPLPQGGTVIPFPRRARGTRGG
jgi:hypothetical protein